MANRKSKYEPQEEVLVEILIRIDGSSELSRITAFNLPIIDRSFGTEDVPGEVQFESKTLIKRMTDALRRLV